MHAIIVGAKKMCASKFTRSRTHIEKALLESQRSTSLQCFQGHLLQSAEKHLHAAVFFAEQLERKSHKKGQLLCEETDEQNSNTEGLQQQQMLQTKQMQWQYLLDEIAELVHCTFWIWC